MLIRFARTCEGVGLRTAGLRAPDVEPGIAARDGLDPGANTEVVREKDQVVAQARRRGDKQPFQPIGEGRSPIACVAS